MILSRTLSLLMLTTFILITASNAKADEDFDINLMDIEIRPEVTVDIHLKVFENESKFCDMLRDRNQKVLNARTIFAVHGRNSTAEIWGPLAEALFQNNPTGPGVCRIVAIDMPGHGQSGLPEGELLFGELSMDDYVASVLGALNSLPSYDIEPRSIIAHSVGGAVIQATQQALVDVGTNLKDEFEIKRVTLFASVPLDPVAWQFATDAAAGNDFVVGCFTGPGGGILPGCGAADVEPDGDVDWDDVAVLSPPITILDCDPNTVPIGSPALPGPIPATACDDSSALGDHFIEPGFPAVEPLNILREILGTAPQVRPSVDAGIFASNSQSPKLQVVPFKNDGVVGPLQVHEDTYVHLTGDNLLQKFKVAEGADDDHLMLVFNPSGMLESIAGTITLP